MGRIRRTLCIAIAVVAMAVPFTQTAHAGSVACVSNDPFQIGLGSCPTFVPSDIVCNSVGCFSFNVCFKTGSNSSGSGTSVVFGPTNPPDWVFNVVDGDASGTVEEHALGSDGNTAYFDASGVRVLELHEA